MTKHQKSGTVEFLGNVFMLEGLEVAFNKTVEIRIEKDTVVHPGFVQLVDIHEQFPKEWHDKFVHPIFIQHEGKYLLVFCSDRGHFQPPIERRVVKEKDEFFVTTTFKARMVSKFNFNKAKYVEPPKVDTTQPIYNEQPRQYQNNWGGDRPRFGHPNQGGGGYGNRRFGGRSN